jgi:RNA polymerase sigma factor (sigma-70 family)
MPSALLLSRSGSDSAESPSAAMLARCACARAAMATQPQPLPDTGSRARILEQVLARSHRLLLGQARRHAQLEADGEEALQSACAIFIEKYRPPAEPLPWLMTTVKREAWRISNRCSRKRELAITAVPRGDGNGTADLSDAFLDPDSDPAEAAETSELLRHGRVALAQLKPDQRTALLMFALGYSYAEIAERRGWTYTKVNRCLAEGRAALQARVALG